MIQAVIFDCFGVLTASGAHGTNEALFTYIRDSLKPTCKVGLISNVGSNMLDELFEQWQIKLFDEAVLSYQVGMVKPDPGIYELAATRLGALPEECIFIDDIEDYCIAAEKVGMHAIWHQDSAKTIANIEELLHA